MSSFSLLLIYQDKGPLPHDAVPSIKKIISDFNLPPVAIPSSFDTAEGGLHKTKGAAASTFKDDSHPRSGAGHRLQP
jgi:hypothetical protein